MTGLDNRHSDRTINTDYNYRNGLLYIIQYTVCPYMEHVQLYSEYKTHIGGLEVEVCFCSNQDANKVVVIV